MTETIDISWIPVPHDSRIVGQFEVGHMVPHLIIMHDDREIHLIVERDALERIAKLAEMMLAIPDTDGTGQPQVVFESACDDNGRERTRLSLVQEAR